MSEKRVKLESMGVYLPERVVSMEELVGRCKRRPRWDLERITGIKARRVAEGEFAQDLAIKAARRALALSRYGAGDLDALICTSISKHNAQDRFTMEPSTAHLIAAALGAERAIGFDLVNACAGMLNGIYVLQGMIRSGAIRRGMVVSGEQNMPLAESAIREIRHSFDGQIAALTLGDAGAAVIVDAVDSVEPGDARTGFHWMELVTGAKHDHYCYSRPSSKGRGGILITKARGLQRKGSEHFPYYLKRAIDGTGWTFDDIQHAIPHQVSVRAITQGVRAVKRYLGCELPDCFRATAERYANTTTTSHFVALHELIMNGQLESGHNVLFISGASGIVISHATMTFDDLPRRYRAFVEREDSLHAPQAVAGGAR